MKKKFSQVVDYRRSESQRLARRWHDRERQQRQRQERKTPPPSERKDTGEAKEK